MRRCCLLLAAALTGIGCGDGSKGTTGDPGPDASVQDASGQDVAADATMEDAAQADVLPEAPWDGGGDVVVDAEDDAMDAKADAAGTWAPFGLLSLNLHCLKLGGTGFPSNEARFAAIAEAVHAENVGAVAAQEVCSDASVDALAALKSALEAATGDTWSTAYAFAHTAWQGTPEEAQEGVGLLVRGALSDVQTLEYRTQAGLRRVAIIGRLPAELGSLRVMSVHLDHMDAAAREAQARESASFGVASADPDFDLVLAGDFNAVRTTPTLADVRAFGFIELTASLDPSRIDHILSHRAGAVAGSDARVVFDGTDYPVVSDHPGMLVTLSPSARQPWAVTRLRAEGVPAQGSLWVRGDAAPLSWSKGWPAHLDAAGGWNLVMTNIPEGKPFHYKFLRDDTDWQQGDDEDGIGGQDHVVTPTF